VPKAEKPLPENFLSLPSQSLTTSANVSLTPSMLDDVLDEDGLPRFEYIQMVIVIFHFEN